LMPERPRAVLAAAVHLASFALFAIVSWRLFAHGADLQAGHEVTATASIPVAPFAYAAGQVLAQAVEATKSLDHDKLANYIHAHKFSTVAGEIAFGKDGEWTKSRQFFTQFQGVSGNDLAQFRDTTHQVILWPPEY